MDTFINSPWQIGTLKLPHRLIQGPLAGFSCAPFRVLFNQFSAPAYCVTEMISAKEVLVKPNSKSRYTYRHPKERILSYQISGNEQQTLANAALLLQSQGADLIDLNCGCPKSKIRKKGAGSALLEDPGKLIELVKAIRLAISIPFTVKIRIQGNEKDISLAQALAEAGADALIVHGRRWCDDYDKACDLKQIAFIKTAVSIPVIANGDIHSYSDLERTYNETGCDGFMIARSGSGKPWIYQELLNNSNLNISKERKFGLFLEHLKGLMVLENEYKAVLQSKTLIRYYFRQELSEDARLSFYGLNSITAITQFLSTALCID